MSGHEELSGDGNVAPSLQRVRHNNHLSFRGTANPLLAFPLSCRERREGGGDHSYFTTLTFFSPRTSNTMRLEREKDEAAEAGGAAEGLPGEPSALCFSHQEDVMV